MATGARPAMRGPPPLQTAADAAAARAHVRAVVARSGTSFFWAMRLLARPRREAMFAIYAFCREVDDVADGDDPPAMKLARLAEWRAELDRLYAGRPTSFPTLRALAAGPVAAYGLRREDFAAIIDGMEMDATGRMVAPSLAELELYCARVAGAVGLLSLCAFGARGPHAPAVADALGQALQLTNILRDLHEDAAAGRLYLPRELLAAHGIAARDPDAVLADPALPAACADLAALARRRFDEAAAAIARGARRPLRPAIVMMTVYRRLLERLADRGWSEPGAPVPLSKAEKVWIAVRHGLL
ncbi:MAG TPA: presqualene diphosphate synthase HpnD [Geminicoccaceae bacterium]|nr:presqualene diphosphate synthase HpnD [Geminicoccaceae bacterium]